MKFTTAVLATTLAAAASTGCSLFEESKSGTVRGRVVGANGQPISGVRVALDRVGGRTTLSNIRGEFRIGGASAGEHTVLAYSVAQDAAGYVTADVDDGDVVDVGDVLLADCDEIELLGGSPGPDGSVTDGGDPSIQPCVTEPPPPPAPHVTIASLSGDYADGFVDPWGVYGYADDSSESAGFDFWVSADLTAGGTFSDHVINDYNNGVVEAHVGLFTYADDGWGHYYVLREGDVTVTVSDDGDADPSTLSFSFSGTNLVFEYAGWAGIDPGYTATVASATAAGTAWQYIPPTPPTADVTIAPFITDWSYLSLCPACAIDGGDSLYVYAFDETNGADISLMLPVSALALGGTATVTGNWETEIYGYASVYSDAGAWGYDLDHASLTAGAAIVSGELFALTLADAQFDYIDAYGGGVVVMEDRGEPDSGTGGTPTEPPVSDFQLFIGSADLSAIVDEYFCGDPGGEPGSGGDGEGDERSPPNLGG